MTVRELARLAGVSHTTVSRALTDNPRLAPETRERIKALARKHGYQPNPLVSKLMAQLPYVRKHGFRSTLALITNSSPRWRRLPFNAELFTGMQARAESLGYKLEEFSFGEYDYSGRALSKVLHSRGVEGILVFPLVRGPGRLSLDWSLFTSVALGHTLAYPALDRVSFTHYHNIMLALRALRGLGYRRIGLALPRKVRPRVSDAYVAAYLLHEYQVRPSESIPILVREHLEPREVASWIRKHRIDAVLCNFDPTVEALRAEGFRIPEELGYATLDRLSTPAEVSGIDQQPGLVGSTAVDMLTALLYRNERGIPKSPKLTLVQGVWCAGATVRKQQASDRR